MEKFTVQRQNRAAFKRARILRGEGYSISHIARIIGKKRDTVLCWLSAERRAQKRVASREYERRKKERRQPGHVKLPPAGGRVCCKTKHAADMRVINMLNEAGPDSRDLTGRIYGDPLPHRSAAHNWRPQKHGYTPPPIVPYEPETRDDGQVLVRR